MWAVLSALNLIFSWLYFIAESQWRNRVVAVPARYGTLALGHSMHACQDAFIKPLKKAVLIRYLED